jgi:Tfp pilus assembly protein FimT
MKPARVIAAVVTDAIVVVIAAILIWTMVPRFINAYHGYALSNSAIQVKNILLITHYEAIRLNQEADFVVNASASDPPCTDIWVDANRHGNPDPHKITIRLCSQANLVDESSVPGTESLIAQAIAGGDVAVIAPSPKCSRITFDPRGAATSGNWKVYYLANAGDPDAGYRAVILAPSGATQIWTSDASGNWQPSDGAATQPANQKQMYRQPEKLRRVNCQAGRSLALPVSSSFCAWLEKHYPHLLPSVSGDPHHNT